MNEDSEQQVNSILALEALGRLLTVAQKDTGQSARVASFLLAWHNAEESGAWDPVDLWSLDTSLRNDVLLVLRLLAQEQRYPGDLGFEPEMKAVWRKWRQH